jgi:hypothetical protein
VSAGQAVVIIVPRWHQGDATDVQIADSGILAVECTILLTGHGRRAILLARRPGKTSVFATVSPASQAAMPAWLGQVTVRAAASRAHRALAP